MNACNRFYITTAIPYVNAAPHMGHALEAVQVDAIARYHRGLGASTYFLTGSDDNSITNVRAAEREGIPVATLVNRNAAMFEELDRRLDVSFDQFIRTSVDPRHAAGAQKLWRAVDASGDIYRKNYDGLYCPNCELFYDEDELVEGLCPEHLIPPERVQETNYFFRLSRYQHSLDELIASDTYRVIPEQRKNEVLSFIRSGLRDFSISRSVERAKGWGVPVPGDDTQVMYVWFDALSNYITGLGYAGDDDLYRRYWIDNPCRVHGIGKGITRFHAIYWPATLLSAGVPLPHTLFVHGYYTIEGRKMSKSLGNVIDPLEVVDRYGSEAVRYYFLGATHPTMDSDFSIANFEARYNSDLANDLGNLLNRTVSMIGRYRGGMIPTRPAEPPDSHLSRLAHDLRGRIAAAMAMFELQQAVSAIWEVIGEANRYVEQQAPWKLAREEAGEGGSTEAAGRLDEVLFTLANTLRLVAGNLMPFLPRTAAEMLAQIGLPEEAQAAHWSWPAKPVTVGQPKPLFPRLDRD